MQTVQVSNLRRFSAATDVVITAQVLGLEDEKGELQYYVGLSHSDAVPIGLLVDHNGEEFRTWMSLQLLHKSICKYLERPVATMTVIDARVQDRTYVDFFIKLFDLTTPYLIPSPLETARQNILNRLTGQVGEEAGHFAKP